MDGKLLGFSIHGILQARILEWIAISFSRGSSQPRDQTQVSRIAGRRFNLWAAREALILLKGNTNMNATKTKSQEELDFFKNEEITSRLVCL